MADLIDDGILALFAAEGAPAEAANMLFGRLGDIATRYTINNVGVQTPELQREVAGLLQAVDS